MIYFKIKKEIESFGFNVVSHEFERTWGGFLVHLFLRITTDDSL